MPIGSSDAGRGKLTEKRFYCPQPVLSLRVAKRKGEKWAAYSRRFERWQKQYGRLLALRTRLEDRQTTPAGRAALSAGEGE